MNTYKGSGDGLAVRSTCASLITEVLVLESRFKLDGVVYICNPHTPVLRWEAEAGESARSLCASQPGVK